MANLSVGESQNDAFEREQRSNSPLICPHCESYLAQALGCLQRRRCARNDADRGRHRIGTRSVNGVVAVRPRC